jgi:DNA-binding Lrp family transcriptional regulator
MNIRGWNRTTRRCRKNHGDRRPEFTLQFGHHHTPTSASIREVFDMQEIDQRDRELLNALQGDVPLVSTPFAFIGQQIDMSEKEVIKRTERLKRETTIRQINASFDMRALGYRSCLVAARVSPERIDDAAAIVNAHPGVTQNYRRNHEFNLWFTIAVAPGSSLGLEKTIEILGDEADCEVTRSLPTLKLYKSSSSDGAETHAGDVEPTPLTELEIESVRLLQHDLPLQPRPFEALAKTANLGGEDLLATARTLLSRGQMRRYGAFIPAARKPGFSTSAMGVWVVPQERADELGQVMSQHRAVSHCYLRPTYSDWAYNLYTTVHGRSVDECESIINDLAIDTGLTEKKALYPTREYKKARVTFFAPDAEEWEAAHATARAASAAS